MGPCGFALPGVVTEHRVTISRGRTKLIDVMSHKTELNVNTRELRDSPGKGVVQCPGKCRGPADAFPLFPLRGDAVEIDEFARQGCSRSAQRQSRPCWYMRNGVLILRISDARTSIPVVQRLYTMSFLLDVLPAFRERNNPRE
ncbi:hypothetical protein G5I_03395 [Acromyrmex echinatior]|uniref:Uncharacterized protein n=1 Tax=Acromyrmex echinatior TaxID=103372 RepID=F4WCW2_ACREC|nr:hypothetical protein G5I_03395 [Acromyrmex echinatior]